MTLTAHVTHTTKATKFGDTVYHYQINLSNGISAKRQAQNGAQGVAFDLRLPERTTASKNVKRLISKWQNVPGYVVVNLETEEVTICG
tara:strand:- start:87 stop:350 length:264 start_codon:yes stop_codon:yes gene_type:complete